MWFEEAVFYQIYPLGFCGAPFENDGKPESRILKVLDWIPHMKKLGINAIYFSPVFESDTHGYNTRDYGDRRHCPRACCLFPTLEADLRKVFYYQKANVLSKWIFHRQQNLL